ncbi:SIR2 family NAD-dependent protein deacylase [Natronomonas sp. EA1]|uniref:SIR2 family NAD-dependent protein deacylase n=1 Tax=Natronomonas sp. EA1 TaxID=3421655 RepID=UPI003EBCB2A3
MTDIDALAAAIREAETTVAFTGAGVSTASGIPDFRSEDGIWTRYDPKQFHVSRFRADPGGFWCDRAELVAEAFDGVAPNPAHEALADLERAGQVQGLITQNVDGLHQQAGSDPIEIHGNGDRTVCTDCRETFDAAPAFETVRAGESPPTCRDCGGVLKPDVTLFGESLPQDALFQARRLAREADVFLAIGSSLTVEPAASLPREASRRGATLAIVNLDETDASSEAAFDLRADVTDVLPALRDRLVG